MVNTYLTFITLKVVTFPESLITLIKYTPFEKHLVSISNRILLQYELKISTPEIL